MGNPAQNAALLGRQKVNRQRRPFEPRQRQAAGDGKAARVLHETGLFGGLGAADAAEACKPLDGNPQGRLPGRARPRQRFPRPLVFGQPAAALQLGAEFCSPRVAGAKPRSRSATAVKVASITGGVAQVPSQPGQFRDLAVQLFRPLRADVGGNLLQQAERLVILMFGQAFFGRLHQVLLHLLGQFPAISMIGLQDQ